MAKIDELMSQHAGRGASKESGVSTYEDLFRAALADLTELRGQFVALLQKLDDDSADTGGDSNYEATLTPAALALE